MARLLRLALRTHFENLFNFCAEADEGLVELGPVFFLEHGTLLLGDLDQNSPFMLQPTNIILEIKL